MPFWRHAVMRPYLDVLRTPGLIVPLAATVLGALPLGMLSLGLFLYVHSRTGSPAQAGLSAGAFGLGNAVGLSAQGWLIDRYGQGRVVAPAGVLCAVTIVVLVVSPPLYGPVLCVVAGGCVPATTGSMRVLLG